jgi:hypothetical protein
MARKPKHFPTLPDQLNRPLPRRKALAAETDWSSVKDAIDQLDQLSVANGLRRDVVQYLIEQQQDASHERLIDAKLELLMDHFDIKPRSGAGSWKELARRLAETFIRGFQLEPKAAGAPLRWSAFELSALKEDVELVMSEGANARKACELLVYAQSQGVCLRYPRCNSTSTLYRRYHQAKRTS